MTGTIIKKTSQGYGFIREDGKPEDDKGVFFHSENVVGTTFDELNEGNKVSFSVAQGDKGPFATDVTLV